MLPCKGPCRLILLSGRPADATPALACNTVHIGDWQQLIVLMPAVLCRLAGFWPL